MSRNKGWQKKAITLFSGTKKELKTLPDYWIIPKKLDLDAMQQLTIDKIGSIDIDKLKGKDETEIRDAVQTSVNRSITIEELRRSMKVAFLNGVYDHNFTVLVDATGQRIDIDVIIPNNDAMSDDEYQKVLLERKIVEQKVKFDSDFFEEIAKYNDTVYEIYHIIMDFNLPLERKTLEKSAT